MMDELYRDAILEHYERPHHHDALAQFDTSHAATNPLCGDTMHVEVLLSPDHSQIVDVAFHGRGCIISQAAASMLADAVVGQPVAEVLPLEQDDMLALLGVTLTGSRRKCAVLGLKVLKLSLYNYLASTTSNDALPLLEHPETGGKDAG